jgi:hypothetical protein
MKLYSIAVYLIIIFIYYIVGGESFPDYLNYVTISEKGGYLFFENEYFAEWISRAWLAHAGDVLSDHYLSVDLFALGIQIFYFIWLLIDKEKSIISAKFWITVFMGPLLLTTALRATVPYLCVFQFFFGKPTRGRWLLLGGLSVGFHDSALIPFILIANALLWVDVAKIRKLNILLWGLSLVIIYFGSYFVDIFISVISSIGVGIRDVYFLEYQSPSLAKFLYANLMLFLTCITLKTSIDSRKVLMLMSVMFVSSLLFAIASTPAIRMYIYVFGICLVLISRSDGFLKSVMLNRGVLTVVPPLILMLSFYDLFKNAAV